MPAALPFRGSGRPRAAPGAPDRDTRAGPAEGASGRPRLLPAAPIAMRERVRWKDGQS